MSTKTNSSKVHPTVFVFPLSEVGTWLKQKVPTAYADCAGYFHRAAHEEHFEVLGAIDEPEMDADDAEKILGWVEEYVDVCSLREALYTDEEYEAIDEPDVDNFGFHAGTTFDEAVQALESGGFRAVRVPFPQSLAHEVGADYATQLDAVMARIEHHLTFASIPSALRVLEDSEQVSLHLRQVMTLLGNFLGSESDDRLAARLIEALATWPSAHTDKLHLVLSEIEKWAHRRSQAINPNIGRVRAALPPPEDTEVARAMERSDRDGTTAPTVARKVTKTTKS